MTTYDAILPAGGTIPPEFAERVGTPNKALIRFGERTILERTLDALNASGRVNRSIVIGTEEVLQSDAVRGAHQTHLAGGSGPDNIVKGLKALAAAPNPPQKVLIVTTDLPFLTGEIVNDFLNRCPVDTDICVPLITKEQYQGRFPNSTATFVPLKDNVWTTGCAYVVDVQAFVNALPYVERVFQNRKSKLGMAKLLGPTFLVKFLSKTLTVPDVEAKIRSLLNCSGRAILNAPPELAYDIDDLEDYEYATGNLL